MNAALESSDYFRELAAHQIDRLPATDPDWLTPLRLGAIRRLQSAALPERSQEGWRYTSMRPILEHRFSPCTEDFTALQLDDIEELLLPAHEDYHRLVILNGRFAPQLSSLGNLPGEVRICGLREALQKTQAPILRQLGSLDDGRENFFADLNLALMGDGAFIRVGRGLSIDNPIELLHIAVGRDDPPMIQPRHLVLLEEGARATVIERFVSLATSVYFNNCVSEIFLERAASLEHQRLQEESTKALHLAGLHLRQGEASRYNVTTAALGAAWSRTEFNVGLAGPGSEAVLNGLYMAGDRQLTDVHLDVRHEVPDCSSRERFKGILDGRGIAVFDGRVLVQKQAQQTEAHLTNANLVLSRHAEIDTKPRLEIYADDVQCSHGTTVGQLDPDMLFYMRSRGIAEAQARELICLGFAGEILETFREPALHEHSASALRRRLQLSAGPGSAN